MSYFTGKTVWITGASSGIGEALAMALAQEGARLVLSSRKEEELRRVQKASGLNDKSSLILPLDLENLSNGDQLVEAVTAKFGSIDILINNGGMSQRAFVKDAPLSIDRKLMEVNYFGPVALTKSVLPVMINRKQGQIVVISSISGKFGFFLRSAYSSAKHALHGFFESLRLELFQDNIQVLIVCPGKIATNISVNALMADGKRFNRMDAGQAEGMPASVCARLILEAIRKQKEEVVIGNVKEKLAVRIKRFFPGFFSQMIRKQKVE
jgi:short-subunit dehydrogenase